jgi:hypothetical protein
LGRFEPFADNATVSCLMEHSETAAYGEPLLFAEKYNADHSSLGALRPGRNAQQAAIEVEELLFRGHREVVDADLADFLEAASYCPQLMEVVSDFDRSRRPSRGHAPGRFTAPRSIGHAAFAATAGLPKSNSSPVTQITASLRATATVARFMPREVPV